MNNYTKGKWTVVQQSSLGYCNINSETGVIAVSVREANAQLIASAPDLYEACKAQHDAIDMLFARLIELDKNFFPSKSGRPWEAIIQGNKALAKAEGK